MIRGALWSSGKTFAAEAEGPGFDSLLSAEFFSEFLWLRALLMWSMSIAEGRLNRRCHLLHDLNVSKGTLNYQLNSTIMARLDIRLEVWFHE